MRFRPGRGQQGDRTAIEEDQTVRRYRYLLRTAPTDALEAAHVHALRRLTTAARTAVLAGVQDGFAAGNRVNPDDVAKVAHLLTAGERRNPGAFLFACQPSVLADLAAAVIHSQEAASLFAGYAAWDGADPEPEDESAAWAQAGFNPDSGRWSPERTQTKLWEGGATGAGGGFDSGGGG